MGTWRENESRDGLLRRLGYTPTDGDRFARGFSGRGVRVAPLLSRVGTAAGAYERVVIWLVETQQIGLGGQMDEKTFAAYRASERGAHGLTVLREDNDESAAQAAERVAAK